MQPTESRRHASLNDLLNPAPTPGGIALTEAQFDALRQMRFRYLMCYGAFFIAFAAPRGVVLAGYAIDQRVFWATMAIMLVFQVVFYFYFFRVLRIMGHVYAMIIGYCALVFLPVPGFLFLMVLDRSLSRRLADAWDAYEAAHPPVDKDSQSPAEG